METLEIKEKNGIISVVDHASIGIYGTLDLIDLKKDAQLLNKIPKAYSGKIVLQTKEESEYTISCNTSSRRNNMTETYGDGKKIFN